MRDMNHFNMYSFNSSPTIPSETDVSIKKEPIEEERNDSGINSDSTSPQSSPGNDSNINANAPTENNFTPSMPFIANFEMLMSNYKLLTNPVSQNAQQTEGASASIFFKPEHQTQQFSEFSINQVESSPSRPHSNSPTASDNSDDDQKKDSDVQKNMTPNKTKAGTSCSTGKSKVLKCKYCAYKTTTKECYWEHLKEHIKEDKRLSCHMCSFITEYKHHLEYHLRNHDGVKPYKCTTCEYACVNKSMLSSHMKSHSNVYQYRCANCNYVTKYCHSLKLHLRKYSHMPDLVLNSDGTPNPIPIIDVYGSRRGPKTKGINKPEAGHQDTSPWNHRIENSLMLQNTPPLSMLPFTLSYQLPYQHTNSSLVEAWRRLNLPTHPRRSSPLVTPPLVTPPLVNAEKTPVKETEEPTGVALNPLDLSSSSPTVKTNRRKGPAFKLQNFEAPDFSSDDEQQQDENDQTIQPDEEPVMNVEESSNNSSCLSPPSVSDSSINNNNISNINKNECGNHCEHCDITFGDKVLHALHMSKHNKNDPFMCAMCGEKCTNRYTFSVHMMVNAHQ